MFAFVLLCAILGPRPFIAAFPYISTTSLQFQSSEPDPRIVRVHAKPADVIDRSET